MKRKLLIAALALQALAVSAQDIQLPAVDFNQTSKSVVETLRTRHSVRSFTTQELTPAQLSNLCWAACGISRDANHITAPTAMNRQEIRLFVFTKTGVYEYLRKENLLKKAADGDQRQLVAGPAGRGQNFVLDAPVSLVMVMDIDKFGGDNEHARLMTAVDAGIVCQNINLYCEAVGLATVPRATMDAKGIQQLLGLGERQIPVMNNPVGYAK
jgi:nitroreductase